MPVLTKYFSLCKYVLLRFGILASQEDHELIAMDKILERSFHQEANLLDRKNAVLILPAFEWELKQGHDIEVLDWVDVDLKNPSKIYRKLQQMKRRIDLN